MAGPLRFLLDNNFPEVDVLDPHEVDRSVVFEHIRDWRPDLIEAETPDWLIYFEAELAGFAGIVTHDWHQSVQPEEAFAITQTKLAVVTWQHPPDDPVVSWALVIAYMPEISGSWRAGAMLPSSSCRRPTWGPGTSRRDPRRWGSWPPTWASRMRRRSGGRGITCWTT